MRRILHLIETTGPGGAETVFLSLLSGLDPGRWAGRAVVQGPGWVADSLAAVGRTPLVLRSDRRFDVRYVHRLRRIIRGEAIDLVHAHLASTGFYASLAATLVGVPTVVTLHGAPDLDTGQVKATVIGRLSHRVALVSESLRALAVEGGLFREEDTVVIPNGIDTDRFAPGSAHGIRAELGVGPDEVLVGAVGNVRPLKDYPTLLRTAAIAARQQDVQIRFVIVGATDSPDYSELLSLRSDLGLEKHVDFVGFRSDVEHVLRALDVLLLTSSSEGFSLVTVQAMATQIPVVATRSGGPEDILRDGTDGLLCSVGDEEALAEAVLALARDRRRAAEMGRLGRIRAQDEFSIDAMVHRYEALYCEALGLGGTG